MLKNFFIYTLFVHIVTTGYIHPSDRTPSCVDWGFCSNTQPPYSITYASANLAYILYTPHKKQWLSLKTVQQYLLQYVTPNLSHLKTTDDLINLWRPIEQDMHNNAPAIHLTVVSLSNGKLFTIVRGNCALFHVKKTDCTIPACVETIQTMCYNKKSNPKNEFVSLCGMQEWNPGDMILSYTPNMEKRICPETISTNFMKRYKRLSASTQSFLLILHAFAPKIPVETPEQRDAAAELVEQDSACIIIKNKSLN